MKRLVLLGASGSIGVQTIDVALQHPDLFDIRAISVGHNIAKLEEILTQIHPDTVCVQEKSDYEVLKDKYPALHFTWGDEGLVELAQYKEYDLLVNALVGFAGFMPTLKGIETHHDVALANKETLVVGGELIDAALKKYGCKLYPIDSEHSAIFQAMRGNKHEQIKRLIITASGGSFRTKTRDEIRDVTPAEALAHPNWSMGPKITIDSANMMNKGFEVMEAHWLFDIDYDHIDVVIHEESIVHSMVEYADNSVIAQLGAADMRLPIQYALTYPDRFALHEDDPLDMTQMHTLHFHAPDTERFPLLALAYKAGRKGGNLPAVMNAANEVANLAFREEKIPFLMIEEIVISAVEEAEFKEVKTVEDLIEANEWGRQFAEKKVSEVVR